MENIQTKTYSWVIMILIFNLMGYTVSAQTDPLNIEDKKLAATILHLDSLFWKTYNDCKTEESGQFLADDVKFYHDKGGITNGRIALVASIKNNVCGNTNYRLRREAEEGTVDVYPLRNGNEIYGAIISGEHVFYLTQNGKPEMIDGRAKFTQVWLLKDSVWKMTDILSYDHVPADRKQE